ncbi:unnamed protein product [Trichobilharzia szidati]|nr:unnamed protein product [Trichobilharzia szidati]
MKTRTYNFQLTEGSLEKSLVPRVILDNATGEVHFYCDFITNSGRNCNISVIKAYGNDAGYCTNKLVNNQSTLGHLKPNTTYNLQCFDEFGYTKVNSISYETGDQRNVFLEQLQNTSLPDPNEEEFVCPENRDSVKVENVTVEMLNGGAAHVVSWSPIEEKYSQCVWYYMICRVHRRTRPKISVLSLVKIRVDGHLNNIITDFAEDQSYIYKVKVFFKNSVRTKFSQRVEIHTSRAPIYNCNCSLNNEHNYTGIRAPDINFQEDRISTVGDLYFSKNLVILLALESTNMK